MRISKKDSQEIPFDAQGHFAFATRVDSLLQTAAVRRSVELRYLPWRSDPNAHVSRIADRFSLIVTRGRRLIGSHCNVPFRCPSLEGPGEDHGRNKKNNETRNSLGQLHGTDY